MNTIPCTRYWIAAVAALIVVGLATTQANGSDEEQTRPSPDRQAFTLEADDPALEWMPCPEFMPEDCRIAVLQGDPEEGDFDLLFRLEPGTSAANHWHTSAERMILIAGELHVDYEGQETVVMKPGTYAYGPPGLPHSTHCLDGDACVLFIAFEDALDAVPH